MNNQWNEVRERTAGKFRRWGFILLTIWVIIMAVGHARADEILLEPNQLIQGDGENALYTTHWLATLPDGTKWIGTYPTRPYPYDELYRGRPHEIRMYHAKHLRWLLTNIDKFRDEYYVGFVTLFNDFYTLKQYPTGNLNGLKTYEFQNPTQIRDLITILHSKKIQVICYLRTPSLSYGYSREVWGDQPWQHTLTAMQMLLFEYRLDGVYCDNADCGNMRDTCEFMRGIKRVADLNARRNGFERGVIVLHGSRSSWDGQYQGRPDIPVRELATHFIAGETLRPGKVPTDPNHWIIERFHNDRGKGNCIWSYLWTPDSGLNPNVWPHDVMTLPKVMKKINAALGGYHKLSFYNEKDWVKYYLPTYIKKRQEYQDDQ